MLPFLGHSFPAVLAGVRILDASRILAGPFCGQLLGDLGAEVIKVERPGNGDDTRDWGPPFDPNGLSAYYLSCNRNKRGIALDLAAPRGRELFYGLVRKGDVVIENYRPDSAHKLGLAPAQLHAVNPRLIVCSISGFGRTGPLADMPGYDFAIQAMSGLMSITGPEEGPPCKVGVAMTDIATGLYAASAILACLIGRTHSGHGYAIDLSLLDCAVAVQVNAIQAFLTRWNLGHAAESAVSPRQGNAHLQIVPYQLFATSDGWLVLAVGNDGQWQKFATAFAAELAIDERYQTNPGRVRNRNELIPRVAEVLRQRTTKQWCEQLEVVRVPHAPVWTYADLFTHPYAEARGLRMTVSDPEGRPVDLVGSPFHIGEDDESTTPSKARFPPRLGEDTDHILRQLCGLDEQQLAELRQQGVIG